MLYNGNPLYISSLKTKKGDTPSLSKKAIKKIVALR